MMMTTPGRLTFVPGWRASLDHKLSHDPSPAHARTVKGCVRCGHAALCCKDGCRYLSDHCGRCHDAGASRG